MNDEIIATAIDIEKKGLDFYSQALDKVTDMNSKGLLKFLVDEETEHIAFFEALKKGVKKEVVKKEHPLFDKKVFKEVEGKVDVLGIFNIALDMESKGIKFYMDTAENEDDVEMKKFLIKLADMEKEHFRLIREHQEAIFDSMYWEGMDTIRMQS